MDVEEAVKIKNQDIAQHLKLPPVKLHCSMLAEDAIQAAIKDFKEKKAQAWRRSYERICSNPLSGEVSYLT